MSNDAITIKNKIKSKELLSDEDVVYISSNLNLFTDDERKYGTFTPDDFLNKLTKEIAPGGNYSLTQEINIESQAEADNLISNLPDEAKADLYYNYTKRIRPIDPRGGLQFDNQTRTEIVVGVLEVSGYYLYKQGYRWEAEFMRNGVRTFKAYKTEREAQQAAIDAMEGRTIVAIVEAINSQRSEWIPDAFEPTNKSIISDFKGSPAEKPKGSGINTDGGENSYNPEEQFQILDQCLVLINMKPIKNAHKEKIKNYDKPYSGIVIPFNDRFDKTPETLLNKFNIGSFNLVDIFNSKVLKNWDGSDFVDPNTGKPTQKYVDAIKNLNNEDETEKFQNSYQLYTVAKTNEGDKTFFEYQNRFGADLSQEEDVSIEFNGTNPSTARSDIKVKISRKEMSLATIVTSPQYKDFIRRRDKGLSEEVGIGKFYTNSFHPDYTKKNIMFDFEYGTKFARYGYDLTLVDHDIKLGEGADGGASIDLNYRGYQETLLYMPYLDVLGGKELLKNRQTIEDKIMKKLVKDKCSYETIKEAEESVRSFAVSKIKTFKSRLVKRLMDLNLLCSIDIPKGSIQSMYNRGQVPTNPDDGVLVNKKDVKIHEHGTSLSIEKATETAESILNENSGDRTVYFVMFGDLLSIISEMFYEGDKALGDYTEEGLNIYHKTSILKNDRKLFSSFHPRIITLPFNIRDKESVESHNISEIPISISWFAKFLNDQYFSKDVEYLPIGTLIRDILEVGLTNMITEVCFSNWVEKNLQFRVSMHKGLKTEGDKILNYMTGENIAGTGHLGPKGFGLHSNILSGDGDMVNKLSYPLFSFGRQDGYKEQDFYSYIVVHSIGQNYMINKDDYKQALKNQVVKGIIPIIKNLDNQSRPYISVESLSWNKTDQPMLREMRYHNGNSYLPYALGNVYNCTIKLNFCMPFFIPGMLVIIDPYVGGEQIRFNVKNNNFEVPTENIGYQVGLSGYYMITKVNHTLKKDGKGGLVAKTELVTKNILGYGSVVSTTKREEESENCEDYLGLARKLTTEEGIDSLNVQGVGYDEEAVEQAKRDKEAAEREEEASQNSAEFEGEF